MATTALTYFLMAVGATVRVSGAGMGCPDWPKCFGLLVPPTTAAELPPLGTYDYPPGWSVDTFDPLMTWIEYLNRLVGAVVGIAILATLVMAVLAFRRRTDVLVPTVLAFVGVLYAAWLGSRVVAHELAPWMVTAHLMSALVVVSALVVAVVNAGRGDVVSDDGGRVGQEGRRISVMAVAVFVVTLVQGAIGTQVRGILEDVSQAHPELARGDWLQKVGLIDLVHRNLALVAVGAIFFLAYNVRVRLPKHTMARRMTMAAAGMAVVQLVSGSVLTQLSLPPPAQVVHLLVATLILGALTATAILARYPGDEPQ